jgi:outer membrane murein-binding lipoprotein Lpp
MYRRLVLVSLLLAGCNSEPAEEPADRSLGTEIAEDYNEMLDEAAAVEDTAEAAKQRLDAAIDEADGNARD